jgi:hypothetical protein
MMSDPHAKVREAIAWVMQKICESHSDVLTNQQILHAIMPIFIKVLADKPRISIQICRAIESLAVSCAPSSSTQQENHLTQYFNSLF